jgi:hypothetical protein
MHMHARVYGVFAHTHCEYTYVCLSYLCQKTLQLPNFSRLISWSGVCVSYVSVEFWSGRFWVGHAHGYGHGTVVMRKQQAKTRVAVRQCMAGGCVSVPEHGTNISRHEVLLCSPPTAKQAWRLHRIASASHFLSF